MTSTNETSPEAVDNESPFESEDLAHAIADAAWDRKARNLRILDVRGLVSYTDFLVVCHGTSERHAQAIAENVVDILRPYKFRPMGVEGLDRGEWVLVDFIDVVLHVFYEPFRAEYPIETIYRDAPRLPLEAPPDLEDTELR